MNLPLDSIICHDVAKPFPLPDNCIDVEMTSPPYWGLRDYGEQVKSIFGGDSNCEHEWGKPIVGAGKNTDKTAGKKQQTNKGSIGRDNRSDTNFCLKCGAWYGQLGLEPHPQMYINHLVMICREVKRVLKKSGNFYLNMGDTYFGGGQGGGNKNAWKGKDRKYGHVRTKTDNKWLQPKQLLGIPERVMIELQNDGWILRNKIIWYKRNSLPSSAKDRLNNTWEYVFHFVKSLPRTTWLLDVPHNEKGQWMWLAALIDGEGCIGISRCKKTTNHDTFSAYLSVANTCKKLLNKCVEITELGKVHASKLGKNQPLYVWRVNNRYDSTVIAEVYPYLIAKKEQARIVLKFQEGCRYRGGNRGYDYEKKKNLGPPSISEKEWNEKLELFELCKKAKKEIVGYDVEPDLRRTSGYARYFYDLDAIREPHKTESLERAEYGFNVIPRAWKEGAIPVSGGKQCNIDCHPAGKNPGDVLEYNSKYKDGTHGQTPQGFIRDQSIAKGRAQSRDDAKILFPNDPKKQQEYINFIHDHGGDPRGKNPGDIIQFDEEYWWSFIIGKAHSNRFYKKAYEIMKEWMIKNNCFDYAIFYEWYKKEFKGEWKSGTLEKGKADYLSDEKRLPFPKPETRFLGDMPSDFWDITTQPSTRYNPDLEHFAVFPEELVLKPLMASCPKEICKKCGKPRTRIIKTDNPSKSEFNRDKLVKANEIQKTSNPQSIKSLHRNISPDGKTKGVYYSGETVGRSDCGCNVGFDAGVVLDPFAGRGTVGKVAKQLGLHYILFDIKPEYCELARLYIGGQKYKLHKDQANLNFG